VVLTGWAGQVSLGQFAFVGVGAALGSYLTLHRHWEFSIVLLASGLAGAVAAVLIGLPALRIRGLFLAVATLSFSLAMSSWGMNSDYVKWVPSSTERIARPLLFNRVALDTERRYYFMCLAVLLFALLAVRGLRRSRTGRMLIGVRENERAVLAAGINATRAKLTAFAISGFIASVAGALYVHLQQNLILSSYAPDKSIAVFLMVVIGGLGSVPGAILGALYVQSLDWFRNVFPFGLRPIVQLLGSGIGAIIVLMFLPAGIGSLVYDLRDRALRRIARRRNLIVPSLFADVRDDSEFAPGGDKAIPGAEIDFGAVVDQVEGAAAVARA
jgi:branched-chain amino acid transport system permease protein